MLDIFSTQFDAQLKAQHYSTRQFAKHSGLSQSQVSHLRNGKMETANTKTLEKAAEALGMKLSIQLVPDRLTEVSKK